MAVKKILILAANPKDTPPLRLKQEVREIEEALRRAPDGRENFEVVKEDAVTLKALRQALLEHDPQIVHFAGHSEGADGLVLEDEEGSSQLADTKGIARLFGLFPTIECVVLNACYSEVQAAALVEAVSGCLIGMQRAVGDDAARKFAQGFYDGIGYGRSFEQAFQFGLSALDLERLPHEPVMTWGRRQVGRAGKGAGKATAEVEVDDSAEVTRKIVRQREAEEAGVKAETAQRVFVSYKRSAEPDEALAMELVGALGQRHEVFIDQQMTVGTRWKEEISERIRRADAIVVLLSEASVHSEMVALEVSLAQEAAAANGGRPMILPVRVNYREPFEYPLSVYLDEINWAFWQGPQDTSGLIGELQAALRGGALAVDSEAAKAELVERKPVSELPRPRPSAQLQGRKQKQAAAALALEQPEGTMDPESAFYIERDQVDAVALDTIAQQGVGVTVTIKGPRQMGKSSLLLRTMAAAAGKEVVFLDFQLFDQAALQDADTFYRQFCSCLTDELDLEDEVEQYWARPLGNTQRCTRYVERHILKLRSFCKGRLGP